MFRARSTTPTAAVTEARSVDREVSGSLFAPVRGIANPQGIATPQFLRNLGYPTPLERFTTLIARPRLGKVVQLLAIGTAGRTRERRRGRSPASVHVTSWASAQVQ